MTSVLAIGCASIQRSIVLGTVTGSVAGAMSGAYWGIENRERYALQAALYTGIAGGLAGYFIHEHLGERDERIRQETLFNLEKFGIGESSKSYSTDGPVLMAPKVETRWIETQAEGKKLIEGHRVWVITEDPQWISNQPVSTSTKGD